MRKHAGLPAPDTPTPHPFKPSRQDNFLPLHHCAEAVLEIFEFHLKRFQVLFAHLEVLK